MDFPMDFPWSFPRFKASSYWIFLWTHAIETDPGAPEDEVAHRSFAQDLGGEKASCHASEKPWILWMKYGIFDDFS